MWHGRGLLIPGFSMTRPTGPPHDRRVARAPHVVGLVAPRISWSLAPRIVPSAPRRRGRGRKPGATGVSETQARAVHENEPVLSVAWIFVLFFS